MHHQICSFLLLLPLLSFLSVAPPPATQSLDFQAYYGKKHIGTMTISKTRSGAGVLYKGVTDITVTYLVSVDLDFCYQAHYEQGQLYKTTFEYQRNHKLKESCQGQREGTHFITHNDGEQAQVDFSSIEQSLMASYFHEPTQTQAIFSERWGKNIPVEQLADNSYKLTLPDGKESYMIYKDGLCRECRIVSGWGTIVFKR